jgi:hypothetical protein
MENGCDADRQTFFCTKAKQRTSIEIKFAGTILQVELEARHQMRCRKG